jgi:hypothetical protein
MNFRLFNTLLGASLTAIISSQTQAQSATDLELTIRVLGEDENPGELIKQIRMPPPDYFSREFSNPDITAPGPGQTIAEQAQLATEEAEQTAVDSIRERISIDGLDATSGENPDSPQPDTGAATLPGTVVNILDQDLPLRQSLEDDLAPLVDISGAADAVSLPGSQALEATVNTGTEAIVDVTAEPMPNTAVDVSELLDSSLETDNRPQLDSLPGGNTDFSGAAGLDVETVNDLESIEDMNLAPNESITDGVEQLTDSLLNNQ